MAQVEKKNRLRCCIQGKACAQKSGRGTSSNKAESNDRGTTCMHVTRLAYRIALSLSRFQLLRASQLPRWEAGLSGSYGIHIAFEYLSKTSWKYTQGAYSILGHFYLTIVFLPACIPLCMPATNDIHRLFIQLLPSSTNATVSALSTLLTFSSLQQHLLFLMSGLGYPFSLSTLPHMSRFKEMFQYAGTCMISKRAQKKEVKNSNRSSVAYFHFLLYRRCKMLPVNGLGS